MGTSALFISVGLLMAGTGLQQILLGVRGTALGFRHIETGAVLSAYYAGYLLGSTRVPHLIGRVGHVRVFAALASAASSAVLLHAVSSHPLAWGVIRLFHGACMAGLFVVAESWLNEAATNETRGHLLSVYMAVVLGSMGAGQFLLNVADVRGTELFILSSILVSAAAAAVAPVSLTRHGAPILTEPQSVTARALSVVYDLRGHGASTPGRHYRLADHVADLVAVLDHLGVGRAHLVGLDGGTTVAAALAARRPDRVATLTLTGGLRPLDPEVRRSPPRAGLASGSRWVGQALSRGHAGAQIRARSAYEPDEDVERFALLVDDWQRANHRARRDSSGALESPARPPVLPPGLPVCCIVGDQDRRLKAAQRVAQAYGAALHRVEGAKRLPPLDRPVHFDTTVLEFLAEHDDRATPGGADPGPLPAPGD